LIRPLTREKKSDGSTYFRPEAIEKTINTAAKLASAELRRRALITDRQDPRYLPSECLVYFIREARRQGDEALASDLLQALLPRCARILKAKIRDDVPNAGTIRESVLGDFVEMFLRDGGDEQENRLDIYEVRFNLAFRGRWLDAREKEMWRAGHEEALPLSEGDRYADADEAIGRRVAAALAGSAVDPTDAVTHSELRATIQTLPIVERKVVALHYFWGFDIESDDPKKRTVATILGVSGRTVRTKHARALKTLRARMEADND